VKTWGENKIPGGYQIITWEFPNYPYLRFQKLSSPGELTTKLTWILSIYQRFLVTGLHRQCRLVTHVLLLLLFFLFVVLFHVVGGRLHEKFRPVLVFLVFVVLFHPVATWLPWNPRRLFFKSFPLLVHLVGSLLHLMPLAICNDVDEL
jgi:hypothetical protein